MSVTIEQLKREVEEAQSRLCQAQTRLLEARLAEAEFKAGDVVEAFHRGSWERAVVRNVSPQSFGTWYSVSFAKKNGEWSKQVVSAFGKVRAVES